MLSRRSLLVGALAAYPAFHAGGLRAKTAKVDVVVIGAGMSGLNAAHVLAGEGARVIVLEAGGRVGGRAYTADHIEGRPELGASQIGPFYARVRDVCQQLGVKLLPGSNINAPFAFSVQGALIGNDQWESHALNDTVGWERGLAPSVLLGAYLERFAPFDSTNDWLQPDAEQYDIAVDRWLRDKGVSPGALRLMNQGLAPFDLSRTSLLRLLQESTRGRLLSGTDVGSGKDRFERAAVTSARIEGGTSRLAEAMAERLGDVVKLQSPVAYIENKKASVEIRCLDGARYEADFAVAAAPFGSLRRVTFDPPLRGNQAEAVSQMPYANNTQVHMRLKGTPFWEQDGLDASIWSDGALNMVRQPIGYDGSRDRLLAICVGQKGNRLDQLPPKERGEFVIREIERIRPSTIGKLEVTGVHSWGRYLYVHGCGHSYHPGQMKRFIHDMIEPHGRVHFAGEHTRRAEIGMESAMESGERAALEILLQLP